MTKDILERLQMVADIEDASFHSPGVPRQCVLQADYEGRHSGDYKPPLWRQMLSGQRRVPPVSGGYHHDHQHHALYHLPYPYHISHNEPRWSLWASTGSDDAGWVADCFGYGWLAADTSGIGDHDLQRDG